MSRTAPHYTHGFQSRVKVLGRVSVVHLVKVLPYSAVAAGGNIFYTGPAWGDKDVEDLSAVENVMYSAVFLKKSYNLQNAVYFLSDLQPTFLMPFPARTEREPHFGLEETYGDILPANRDETADCAARRESGTKSERLSLLALAGYDSARAKLLEGALPAYLERERVLECFVELLNQTAIRK